VHAEKFFFALTFYYVRQRPCNAPTHAQRSKNDYGCLPTFPKKLENARHALAKTSWCDGSLSQQLVHGCLQMARSENRAASNFDNSHVHESNIESSCLTGRVTYIVHDIQYKHDQFLQGVTIACYTEPCISYDRVVRLSVRLSHAGPVSKRRKLGSGNLDRRITQ